MSTKRIAVEVWALSPSQYENYLGKRVIGRLIPVEGVPQTRVSAPRPNHTAIALQITVDNEGILLGSDLEEHDDPRRGWSAIVADKAREEAVSDIFKVPHHGSITAHHDAVWAEMLNKTPIAALTPYNRGRSPLPTANDKERINKRAARSFISIQRPFTSRRRRENVVEKLIQGTAVSLSRLPPGPGHIRMRRSLKNTGVDWSVDLFNGAVSLSDYKP